MLRSLSVLFLALAVAIELPAQSPVGRPVVLVVHGRGQTARDTAGLRRDALHALRVGAEGLAGDSLLRGDDVRLVYYADVLAGGGELRDDATSSVCDAALAGKAETGNVFSLLAMVAGALVDAGAKDEATPERDGLKSLTGDLRYLGDQRMRCAAERRLGDALARAHAEGRPVVLVAHSLGALVSWGHLHSRSGANSLTPIERLVTLGSPLGSPDIRQLIFGEDTAPIALPRAVKSWFNIVNPDDPFAVRLSLGDSVSIPGIVDAVTSRDAGDPHELRSYLRDDATRRAVLGAWCAGFTRNERPKACASFH
jgi:hypothetical protein